MRTVLRWVAAAAVPVVLGACGGGGTASDRPQVVVTTSVLGDVVANLVGHDASVLVLMPPGTDPHAFAPSARQARAVRSADLLVVNGLGLEEGLVSLVEGAVADGVPVVTATEGIEPLPLDDEGTPDPHPFTDPVRLRSAAARMATALAERIPALGSDAGQARIRAYLAELDDLDAEVVELLADVPADRRVLVTNHAVLGYFAERYDFEVLGAIVPGGATLAEPSAADLAALADLVRERGVPAVFADVSSPARLAEALAGEGTSVPVVELYSEALGEAGSGADTYVGMMRTNAERIAAALG